MTNGRKKKKQVTNREIDEIVIESSITFAKLSDLENMAMRLRCLVRLGWVASWWQGLQRG